MKKYISRFGVSALCGVLSLCAAPSLYAAEVYMESPDQYVGVGEAFEVHVFVDTEGESINAVEAELVFPDQVLDLTRIATSDSVVGFWVEKDLGRDGVISLSGVIPGGFRSVIDPLGTDTTAGKLATLTFKGVEPAAGSLVPIRIRVLLNDGKGTATSVETRPLTFNVFNSTADSELGGQPAGRDSQRPEPIDMRISKSDLLPSDGYYLFFGTIDKGSGIHHYEVKEGDSGWVEVESPYLLTNQKLTSDVSVKAVDNAGNERVAVLPPQREREEAAFDFAFLGIVLVVVAIIFTRIVRVRSASA